jgi:hypothetical protein
LLLNASEQAVEAVQVGVVDHKQVAVVLAAHGNGL